MEGREGKKEEAEASRETYVTRARVARLSRGGGWPWGPKLVETVGGRSIVATFSNIFSVMVSAKAFEREKGGHGEPYIKIWWWKLGMNPAEYRSIVYRIV